MPLGSQAGSANSQPKIGTCPPPVLILHVPIPHRQPGRHAASESDSWAGPTGRTELTERLTATSLITHTPSGPGVETTLCGSVMPPTN